MSRAAWWVVVAAAWSAASGARAQTPTPLSAVVEVTGVAIDPTVVRQAIAQRLSRPVISPLELGAAPGTRTAGSLTVAVAGGRAFVHYRDASGREEIRAVLIGDPAQGVVAIADAAAALVRRASEPFALPSEVLDPFSNEANPQLSVRVGESEVMNPWQPLPPGTRFTGLAPWPESVRTTPPTPAPPTPAPPALRPPAAPAIERAGALATPRPGVEPDDQ